MGERVNIQYSVDIDDLGDEVCRLICSAFENLNSVNDGATAPENNILSLRTIQQIDEIRQELGNIDLRLNDAVNLINGYIAYRTDVIDQQQTAAAAEQVQQPEAADASSNLSDLRERVRELAYEDAN